MNTQSRSCAAMRPMERAIRALAGTFVTVSVLLGYFVSSYWLLFTLFIGLNLLQSSVSSWCLAEQILAKFGIGIAKPSNTKQKTKALRSK